MGILVATLEGVARGSAVGALLGAAAGSVIVGNELSGAALDAETAGITIHGGLVGGTVGGLMGYAINEASAAADLACLPSAGTQMLTKTT